LNAHVAAVGHHQAPAFVEQDVVRGAELSRPRPKAPKDLMNLPSLLNTEMRATVSGGALGAWPEWPSDM
jgi:hypothetical protein